MKEKEREQNQKKEISSLASVKAMVVKTKSDVSADRRIVIRIETPILHWADHTPHLFPLTRTSSHSLAPLPTHSYCLPPNPSSSLNSIARNMNSKVNKSSAHV